MAGDVLVRLRQALPTLRPAEARIADVVLDDPTGAVGSTITELAARAATSQATVVRFCRAVGYAGYPEFRIDLAQATSRRAVELERSGIDEGEIDPADDAPAVVSKIAFHEARTIEETARLLDLDALERAVAAVADASRTDVFGVGSSGLTAQDLARRLARIGLVSLAPIDPHDQLRSAALLGPGTVAVGISHTGRTPEPCRALTLARERGATTIAVTSFPASPLGEQADVVLTTTARETGFLAGGTSSRIAQLAVVDVLVVRVAQRRRDAAETALRVTDEAVHRAHP
ncbi:MurR/RpiR family transcriptional regulator [Isoptericola variabilis]|uniref:Transcriptional regulator, RpiR family n=1 Tax=Isoptericola variabilis (strain 225) TaxID=743718 RepID=F6FQJ1_ISOV2|nr:MurR/RpiR family transcriptional regulator [Isoptericola variabilis]AEG44887.1 transcriptional regulator, RpiR family [Isoptericola variabilis 225]TWH28361.1 RpiR family transcriptional regulator [Isoptericola variabilis J7]